MFMRGVKKLYTYRGSSFGCILVIAMAYFDGNPLDVDGSTKMILGIHFMVCCIGETNVVVATLHLGLH